MLGSPAFHAVPSENIRFSRAIHFLGTRDASLHLCCLALRRFFGRIRGDSNLGRDLPRDPADEGSHVLLLQCAPRTRGSSGFSDSGVDSFTSDAGVTPDKYHDEFGVPNATKAMLQEQIDGMVAEWPRHRAALLSFWSQVNTTDLDIYGDYATFLFAVFVRADRTLGPLTVLIRPKVQSRVTRRRE